MSRRNLSKHQRARIDDRQQRHLKQASLPAGASEQVSGNTLTGLVISHFGQHIDVESSATDDSPGRVCRCFKRSNLPQPVCGDRVVYEPDGDSGGVVVAIEARRSEFSRPGPGGKLKPVAANVDQVMIMIAPVPVPHMNLLDRYLVAVEALDLEPVIVINKTDLMPGSDASMQAFLNDYTSLGYPVLLVSALEGTGLDMLRDMLQGKSAVVVGQSGVGKSSLINALGKQAGAQVGQLSEAGEKGTHTTTTAALFHLDGYDLIDSPGIREFDLWPMPPEQLQAGFVEFLPFLGHCRFRDCSHRQEPGCALRQAVSDGHIQQRRLDSYFHIVQSLAG